MEVGFLIAFVLVAVPFFLVCVALVAFIRWLWRKGGK